MRPDTASPARAGVVALVAALVAAVGMAWWAWDPQEQTTARLAKAQADARRIGGEEPLRERVERQRAANDELRANIALLKKEAGFTRDPSFTVPPNEREQGKFFANRFVQVRQALRDQADRRRIERDERLGFPPVDRIPSNDEAQELLDILQMTEKALTVVLNAPDPVEWFDITHAKPYQTGPASRPPLLTEYPLTLKLRGSLPTVLWIMHQFGTRNNTYPLIFRGVTLSSSNTKPKDDVQQIEATFELAAMAFVPDGEREPAGRPAAGPATSGMRARP